MLNQGSGCEEPEKPDDDQASLGGEEEENDVNLTFNKAI